jgi:phosphonate transport system substrate-binding protein
MGQLKARRTVAAGVNSQVMREYAKRENIEYRVLWSSEEYLNVPISAHPSVPREKVKALSDALLQMADDPGRGENPGLQRRTHQAEAAPWVYCGERQ